MLVIIDDERSWLKFLKNQMKELQIDIIDCLDNKRILSLFNYIPKDNIVDILANYQLEKENILFC